MKQSGNPAAAHLDRVAQYVLDAGGESCTALRRSMYRCVASIDDGQILEIVSREPGTREQIPAWCRRTGHRLLRVVERGEETIFWVQKRPKARSGRSRTGDGTTAGIHESADLLPAIDHVPLQTRPSIDRLLRVHGNLTPLSTEPVLLIDPEIGVSTWQDSA